MMMNYRYMAKSFGDSWYRLCVWYICLCMCERNVSKYEYWNMAYASILPKIFQKQKNGKNKEFYLQWTGPTRSITDGPCILCWAH